MQVRRRAGDLREPSIQLGDQKFETCASTAIPQGIARRCSSVHDWSRANFPASSREPNSSSGFRSSSGECVSAIV